jgi:hypothetical protein
VLACGLYNSERELKMFLFTISEDLFTIQLLLLMILLSLWGQFIVKRLHYGHAEQKRKDEKLKARCAQIIGRLAKPLDILAAGTALEVLSGSTRGELYLVNRHYDSTHQLEKVINIEVDGRWERGNRSIVITMAKVALPEFDKDYAEYCGERGDYHFRSDDAGVERALKLLNAIAERPELLQATTA